MGELELVFRQVDSAGPQLNSDRMPDLRAVVSKKAFELRLSPVMVGATILRVDIRRWLFDGRRWLTQLQQVWHKKYIRVPGRLMRIQMMASTMNSSPWITQQEQLCGQMGAWGESSRMAFEEGSDISSSKQFKAGSNVVVGSWTVVNRGESRRWNRILT